MAKIIIESGDTLQGEYELDLSYFKNREWHIIKRESGVRALEFWDALNAGDIDLIVALAIIAMRRAGNEPSRYEIENLWEMETGKIRLDVEEDDAGPPEVNGSGSEPPESGPVSSQGSSESSDPSETTPEPSGDPG